MCPQLLDQRLNLVEFADVKGGESFDGSSGGRAQLVGRFLDDILAAAANVHGRSKLEEALGHGTADAGTSSGNQNAFGLKQVVGEHGSPFRCLVLDAALRFDALGVGVLHFFHLGDGVGDFDNAGVRIASGEDDVHHLRLLVERRDDLRRV